MDIGAIFIEEAKDHLDTIEKGLLDLQTTMQDSESVNELFRAAHSVKGGAAMLGFGSIQKIAHRMEDCFKILKENPLPVDHKVESLFLSGFDTLNELIDKIQGPYGLQAEEGDRVVKKAEPIFAELQEHLNHLLDGGPPADDLPVGRDFTPQVVEVLRQMLQAFKQQETTGTRKQLLASCDRLVELAPDVEAWGNFARVCQGAIANPDNPFLTLAPLVIKETKQAAEQLAKGKTEIAPSAPLSELAASFDVLAEVSLPLDVDGALQTLLANFKREQLVKLVKALAAEVKKK